MQTHSYTSPAVGIKPLGACAVPEKFQILSGSALKVIAVLTMLINHIALYFVPTDAYYIVGKQFTLYMLMRIIGRMAFPIFAFLLVEGALHTHDRLRYGINLLVFALISEVPWDLLHYNSWFNPAKQNVFFTLFFGYVGICLFEKFRGNFWLQSGTLAVLFGVSIVFNADFGSRGFVYILMIYALREYRIIQALITMARILPGGWYPTLAFIPLMLYNGKRGFIRGKVLKYAFYAFYPAHYLVLFLIRYYR